MHCRKHYPANLLAALAFCSAFIVQSPAMAAPNCESIKDVFAYNECLAKSAPPVAARGKGGTSTEDPEATMRSGRNGAQVDERGVRITKQSKRVNAVIDPWAGARTPVGQKKRRR